MPLKPVKHDKQLMWIMLCPKLNTTMV